MATTVRRVTDPDEAHALFKAGLLMWLGGLPGRHFIEPLTPYWTDGTVRQRAGEYSDAPYGFVVLIEE